MCHEKWKLKPVEVKGKTYLRIAIVSYGAVFRHFQTALLGLFPNGLPCLGDGRPYVLKANATSPSPQLSGREMKTEGSNN